MLMIEAIPDKLIIAKQIEINFYNENCMPKKAEQLCDELNANAIAMSKKMHSFLNHAFKTSSFIVPHGVDPRFSGFHAPNHHRVTIKSDFAPALKALCEEKLGLKVSYENESTVRPRSGKGS